MDEICVGRGLRGKQFAPDDEQKEEHVKELRLKREEYRKTIRKRIRNGVCEGRTRPKDVKTGFEKGGDGQKKKNVGGWKVKGKENQKTLSNRGRIKHVQNENYEEKNDLHLRMTKRRKEEWHVEGRSGKRKYHKLKTPRILFAITNMQRIINAYTGTPQIRQYRDKIS